MTTPIVPRRRVPLCPQSAFVVHLTTTDAEKPETLLGRVEHVSSGRSRHFGSTAELVGFMRQTLATRVGVAGLLILLVAGAAWPRTAAALCCQRPSAPCADTVGGILACVRQGGTLQLDGICSANLCQLPPPSGAGCCTVGLLQCAAAADTAQACSIRHGSFLSGGRCTILGCLPGIGAPTQTATARSTPTATKTPPSTSTSTRTATASSRPTATATLRPTATATLRPTATATLQPTATVTLRPTAAVTLPPTATAPLPPTATATLPPTTTATASPTATVTLPPTATATLPPTATATATSASTPNDHPLAMVMIDAGTEAEESVHLPPNDKLPCFNPHPGTPTPTRPFAPTPTPALCACPPQNQTQGGCVIQNTVDGSINNFFDASGSLDPRVGNQSDAALSYKWDIIFPPGLFAQAPDPETGVISTTGITGYLTPQLTIAPSSLPSLEGTDAGSDTFWRARLTITENPLPDDMSPLEQTVVYFRFKYQQTQATLQEYYDCQRIGYIDGDLCKDRDVNVLPTETDEAGWTFCAAEGAVCNLPAGREVRFGVPGNYRIVFVAGTSVACNNATFGDPAFGQVKHCEYYIDGPTFTPSSTPTATSTPTGPTSTPTDTPTATATPTPTLACGEQAVVVDAGLDAEEIVHYQPPNPLSCDQRTATVPPAPAPTPLCCPGQNPSGGGCHLLNTMDGSIDNFIDAQRIIDQAACAPNGGTVSVRWDILFPPTLQGAVYTSNGVTGRFSPVLTIRPSSLPTLEGEDLVGSDTFWRARLFVDEYPADGGTEILSEQVFYFRFKYQQSQLTLQMSDDCQRIGHIDNDLCTAVAINGLPSTEVGP